MIYAIMEATLCTIAFMAVFTLLAAFVFVWYAIAREIVRHFVE